MCFESAKRIGKSVCIPSLSPNLASCTLMPGFGADRESVSKGNLSIRSRSPWSPSESRDVVSWQQVRFLASLQMQVDGYPDDSLLVVPLDRTSVVKGTRWITLSVIVVVIGLPMIVCDTFILLSKMLFLFSSRVAMYSMDVLPRQFPRTSSPKYYAYRYLSSKAPRVSAESINLRPMHTLRTTR